MNRRSLLRGLGSVLAWSTCGLTLSAGSCEFEYERQQMTRETNEIFRMMRERETARQLEEAKRLAEERNESIRKVLDEFWQFKHEMGHQNIRGEKCFQCDFKDKL